MSKLPPRQASGETGKLLQIVPNKVQMQNA